MSRTSKIPPSEHAHVRPKAVPTRSTAPGRSLLVSSLKRSVNQPEKAARKAVNYLNPGDCAEASEFKKGLEGMSFEELRVAGAAIDDPEVRETACDLLSRAEDVQKQILDRIIKLIGSKYDPPDSVS